jgi:hypothetical protein
MFEEFIQHKGAENFIVFFVVLCNMSNLILQFEFSLNLMDCNALMDCKTLI